MGGKGGSRTEEARVEVCLEGSGHGMGRVQRGRWVSEGGQSHQLQ